MKTLYISVLLCTTVSFGMIQGYGQTTNFSSGSFIVDMGITPQTYANALKPYGLVYDLVKNYQVPVYWIINPDKLKDGIDFIYNETSYKAGPFIIAAENRNATIDARIAYWQSQGIVGSFSNSSFNAPVAQKITTVPRWTLDMKTGQIAQVYILNAGIPIEATDWTDPFVLNNCNDIFVLPHADPKWDTHNFLIDWNNTYKGSIWVGCHAVSVLENMYNSSNPAQQANFLALNSGGAGSQALVPFGSHKDGSTAYNNNSNPSDQIMQFLGPVDAATLNGSEQIYMPALGGGWRSTTKISVYDPSQINIPSLSPGKAAVIAYGRGYGDANRGWVMYEGGHNLAKGTADDIAAQRAFLNFSYMVTLEKSMNLSVSGIQSVMVSNQAYSVSVSINQSPSSGPYTILWTSSCGGTFSNPAALSTNFTPPLVGSPSNCVISVKVTDACNRSRFFTQTITVTNGPRPPVVNPDALSFSPDCITQNPVITINALTNDTEPDGQPMTISSISGSNGTWSINPDKTIKFIPSTGFYGSTIANYSVCDNTSPSPICNSSTITVTIGAINQQPVPVNDSYTILEDSMQILNVLANDAVGAGGGSLKIAGIPTNPLRGKVSINPDNTITYVPTADNRLIDSFYYRVVNGGGYTATAKVIINFTADGCSAGYYQTCIPGANPISVVSTEDSYIKFKDPTINYGTQTYIAYDREGGDKHRALVKFSLPALTCNPFVPPTIVSAQLKLEKISSNNGNESGQIFQLLQNWNETQVTWDNRLSGVPWTAPGGDIAATPEASQTVTSDGIYTWDITSLVTNWYGNPGGYPNYGVMVKTVEGGGDREHDYASRENITAGVMKPTLVISYTLPTLCSLIPIRAPLSMPDTASTNSLTPVTINVITNDYFPNAGTLTVSIIPGSVSSGSAAVSGNNVIYTPLTSFSGKASLQYRVLNNNTVLADTAYAYIFVSYTAPIANNDSATIYSGGNTTMNVTLNDIDPQNIGINASVIAGPVHGTYTASGNNITYTAPFNFIGRDTITYLLANAIAGICNESNATDTAYFIIIVNNRVPIANNNSEITNLCQGITIDVLQNDADPENGTLSIVSVSSPSPANAGTIVTDGNFVYFTPNPLYGGSNATFTYIIGDDAIPQGLSLPATVTINFTNMVNGAPIAMKDSVSCITNTPIYADVLTNDYDPENDSLNISLGPSLLQPLHGTISTYGNGLIQYIPFNNFSGIDSFQYYVSDTHFGLSGGSCNNVSQSSIGKAYILVSSFYIVLLKNEIVLKGVHINEGNKLIWETEEANSSVNYVIEKSLDNRSYESLTTIFEDNPGRVRKKYEWIERGVNETKTYYRIKMVKHDALPLYSNIIMLKKAVIENKVLVYPVPFSDQLNASIFSDTGDQIKISLYNGLGIIMKTKMINPVNGINKISLENLGNLPAAIYYFTIQQSDQILKYKVAKIK